MADQRSRVTVAMMTIMAMEGALSTLGEVRMEAMTLAEPWPMAGMGAVLEDNSMAVWGEMEWVHCFPQSASRMGVLSRCCAATFEGSSRHVPWG